MYREKMVHTHKFLNIQIVAIVSGVTLLHVWRDHTHSGDRRYTRYS